MKKEDTSAKSNAAYPPRTTDVVIETPKGSRNKYAFDPQTGHFKLSKILAEGMAFPYDFGFVPFTKAADGVPIDVLVLIEEKTFPGWNPTSLASSRPSRAASAAVTTGSSESRPSLLYSNIRDISELNPTELDQIEAFLVNYQKLRNVQLVVRGQRGPERAYELLQADRYGKHAA